MKDWLARNASVEPYTKPRRDRKRTLLQCILAAARADGGIAEAILDYTTSRDYGSEYPDIDSYLTDYRFDLVPHLSFCGIDGISLSLVLEGSFDGSDDKKVTIGTLRTPRVDLEACRLMGALGGALMYHCRKYIIKEVHRYTPTAELERMANRK